MIVGAIFRDFGCSGWSQKSLCRGPGASSEVERQRCESMVPSASSSTAVTHLCHVAAEGDLAAHVSMLGSRVGEQRPVMSQSSSAVLVWSSVVDQFLSPVQDDLVQHL